MKNPWLNYIIIRVGLFVGILTIMLLLQFDPFFAALIAAMVSLAISLVFFNKQRAAVSESIYKMTQKKGDKDSAVEDAEN